MEYDINKFVLIHVIASKIYMYTYIYIYLKFLSEML